MDTDQAVLIALKIFGPSINGPDSWAIRLLPWLRSAGVDARAAILMDEAADEQSELIVLMRQAGVPVTLQRSRCMKGDAIWFMEQVAQFRPGLFIAHHLPAAMYAASNLKQAGVRSAMVIHSDDPFYDKLLGSFVLAGERSSVDVVVAVSEFLYDKISNLIGNRVAVSRIHCGAPRAEIETRREDVDLHLLYVGRFSLYQKRIDEVAKALCLACAQIPGVRASMVGDGSHFSLVESIVKSTPGGEKVVLLGGMPSPEVLKVIPTAHVIVLLSDFEGIPISLMEAMAAGLVPVVTAIRSGIPELVIDGETGFIVKDRSQSFLSAIRRLSEDPQIWTRMSSAARNHFERGFSPESVIEAWQKHIGPRPQPFVLPKVMHFPVNSIFDSWVDSSLATGVGKLRLIFQKWMWGVWGMAPASIQSRIRKLLK